MLFLLEILWYVEHYEWDHISLLFLRPVFDIKIEMNYGILFGDLTCLLTALFIAYFIS